MYISVLICVAALEEDRISNNISINCPFPGTRQLARSSMHNDDNYDDSYKVD